MPIKRTSKQKNDLSRSHVIAAAFRCAAAVALYLFNMSLYRFWIYFTGIGAIGKQPDLLLATVELVRLALTARLIFSEFFLPGRERRIHPTPEEIAAPGTLRRISLNTFFVITIALWLPVVVQGLRTEAMKPTDIYMVVYGFVISGYIVWLVYLSHQASGLREQHWRSMAELRTRQGTAWRRFQNLFHEDEQKAADLRVSDQVEGNQQSECSDPSQDGMRSRARRIAL